MFTASGQGITELETHFCHPLLGSVPQTQASSSEETHV
jgi:hypothetical protein